MHKRQSFTPDARHHCRRTEPLPDCNGRKEVLMFRLWGKIVKDGRTLRDVVIENEKEDTRTHKVLDALNEICYQFDLSRPIWLDANITQFQRHKKTQFKQDSFIETIDFDFLEISILEEDFFYPAN